MTDEIKVIKTTSLGQNLFGSIIGVLVGILFFFGSFILLHWNEGRADLSLLARTAIPIEAGEAAPVEASGKLVSVSGLFTTQDQIGDGLYLKKAPYLALKREVEMFAWDQTEESQTTKNLGGSTTTTTTYRYQKTWTANPSNSNKFQEPSGHFNPEMPFSGQEFRATTGTVGDFSFELRNVVLPPFTRLVMTADMVNLKEKTTLANETYLYRGQGTLDDPTVGDVRVSYKVLEPGFTGTLFGRLINRKVTTFDDQQGSQLFHIFDVDRDAAINQLHSDYVFETWLLRGLGFLAMWLGLGLVVAPIFTLLDIVPVIGTVTRAFASLMSFVIAIPLTLVTILVSMVLHNLVALIIALLVTGGGIIAVLILRKKQRVS